MIVSRRARLLDAAGILLVVIGAACFVAAQVGLARLHAAGVVVVKKGQTFGAVREWERWTWLGWSGMVLVAGGIGMAVWAAVHHHWGTRNGDRLNQQGNGERE